MKTILDTNQNPGTPITLPDMKQIWKSCLPLGVIFWLIGLGLWWQQSLDETILFFYNPARIANASFVTLLRGLTDYGMALLGLPFTMLFANMILKQSKAEQLPFLSMVWGVLLVFLTILFVGM